MARDRRNNRGGGLGGCGGCGGCGRSKERACFAPTGGDDRGDRRFAVANAYGSIIRQTAAPLRVAATKSVAYGCWGIVDRSLINSNLWTCSHPADQVGGDLVASSTGGGRADGGVDFFWGQAAAALQLLLRSGTAGPLVIGAPESFFRPDQIADSVAPMILAAKDRGRQIILSSRETVLSLAIDCENYFIYAASPMAQNKTIKCMAQGGVDRPEVARALLRAFEGDERLIELKRVRLQAGRT